MVFSVLPQEEVRLGGDFIPGPALADLLHDGLVTAGAEENLFPGAPPDSGGPHIPVPGPFFGENGVGGAVSLLIGPVELLQLPDAGDDTCKGIGDRFLHLPHPLFGDMGGTEDHIEGLFLPGGQMAGGESGQADLRFSGTAFRHQKGGLVLVQLSLQPFRRGKLGVVEGVSGFLADVLIDSKDALGEGLRRRVEQGDKLPLDPLGDIGPEFSQIPGDRLDVLEGGGIFRRRAGNGDLAAFQPVLYHLDDVLVVLGAGEQPGVQPFGAAENLQLSQDASCLQLCQQVVLEIGDQRHAGALVNLGKKTAHIPLGTKDVAFAGRAFQPGLLLRGSFLFCCFRVAVPQEQGRFGVDAVVGELPLALLERGIQL